MITVLSKLYIAWIQILPMYLQWPPYEPSISHHYRESAMFYADLEPKDYSTELPYISHVADNSDGCNMYIAHDKVPGFCTG